MGAPPMHNMLSALAKLAHETPELRARLVPLLRTADKWEKLPKGWTDDSAKKFWGNLTGDVKKKVTKCIKKMDGKVDDPGAFCASLRDKVEGPGWRTERRAGRTLRDNDGRIWGPKPGLEGPLLFRGGRILYYDPRERGGTYYDPTYRRSR